MTAIPTFFDGLTEEQWAVLEQSLERRCFLAGATVLSEGDGPCEMYVVESGTAEVVVADGHGVEHVVGRIGPGATMGEMSLFTGQPVSATVRALTNLEVMVLSAVELHEVASAHPRIYRNLGAILSQRLARSNRQSLQGESGRVVFLQDEGGPAELGFALAASLAWHARRAVLLVVVADEERPELTALARRADASAWVQVNDNDGQVQLNADHRPPSRAHVLLVPPRGSFAYSTLPLTLEELTRAFHFVLVQSVAKPPVEPAARMIHLTAERPAPTTSEATRPGHTMVAWSTEGPPRGPDRHGVLHVPPLNDADERALAQGVLPSSTAAGAAIGWAARDVAGLKVGLALGAGSVKGYAHYGAWGVLERMGLVADYVTGTSIGAIIAATYALGFTAEGAARNMEETSHRAFRLTVPTHAILSNAGVHFNFRNVAGDTRFEDLDMPLAMVAADLHTRREVIFRRGLLRTAALASMAIPGIYPPLRMGPYTLVDGGILNPVPSNVTAEMGADVVIAINLGSPAEPPVTDAEATESSGDLPSILQTVAKSVEVMQGRIGATAIQAATVLIEPDFSAVPEVGLRAFHQGRRFIAPGEAAAEAALPRLAAALPWLRD